MSAQRAVSEPFHGPYAVFTRPELRAILEQAPSPPTETWRGIVGKIEVALGASHAFLTPINEG